MKIHEKCNESWIRAVYEGVNDELFYRRMRITGLRGWGCGHIALYAVDRDGVEHVFTTMGKKEFILRQAGVHGIFLMGINE